MSKQKLCKTFINQLLLKTTVRIPKSCNQHVKKQHVTQDLCTVLDFQFTPYLLDHYGVTVQYNTMLQYSDIKKVYFYLYANRDHLKLEQHKFCTVLQ